MTLNLKEINWEYVGAIAIIVGVILYVISTLVSRFDPTGFIISVNIANYLQSVNNSRVIITIINLIEILSFLAFLPGIIAFKQFFSEDFRVRKRDFLIWVPTIGMFLGIIITITSLIMNLIITLKIAPDFLNAIEPEKTQIANQAAKLLSAKNILSIIGLVFVYATGAGGFAIFGFQKVIIPTWLNWLGVAGGILNLGYLGYLGSQLIAQIFSWIIFVGIFCILTWLLSTARLIMQLNKYQERIVKSY
ncbi:MAG: hypothetical protein GF308_19745 [Candidatus Heimdallarchaeota archaeon]|nr:hypothetical protein [Candidatus Heimdallarchaeota archaeon]